VTGRRIALAEVPRFHRAARRVLDHGDHDGQVLADFLRTGGFSRYFTAHFTLPLVAAVWSCPTGTALRYPARYLFAFLANHGMTDRRMTAYRARYADYVARTSGFIPLPPKRAPRRHAAASAPRGRA
jgi:uncharacterized protein